MQQHQLMQMQPMMAGFNPNNVTTDIIQQYLDENKQLILQILDNQSSGKLSECAENQARLQRNLMYLAAIADSQPQPSPLHAQFLPPAAMQGARYLQHQQAQQMTPSSLAAARSSMMYGQQSLSALQQQSMHSQLGMSSGVNSGFHLLNSETGMGGNGALTAGSFSDFGRGDGLQAATRSLMSGGKQDGGHVSTSEPSSYKPFSPPREVQMQVTHSMPPQKIEIFKSLEGWAEENILVHLKPVESCWQPQDFLPDAASDGFYEQVEELRKQAKEIPDDFFVCLIGDMITEEALPTYQTMLNTFDGVRDETGASPTSWAIWTRAWTAEENRHGDLLNKYLYLSGRVDMKQIEKTIQYLIGSGMYPRTENNPYLGFIYTSFQERATFISHGSTARLAKKYGDENLARICGTIASDEKRHETAYAKIVEKLFEIDPDGTVLAFCDMMKKKISMPAHLMYDGQDDNLFVHFCAVAQRLGIYSAKDYADILEFLVGRWNVEKMTGLSPEGRQAQDYVCSLALRIRKLEEWAQGSVKETPTVPFSWIFNRQLKL